jgi:hypothetical protein
MRQPSTPVGVEGCRAALCTFFFFRLLPRAAPAAEPGPKAWVKGEVVAKSTSASEEMTVAALEHFAHGFLVPFDLDAEPIVGLDDLELADSLFHFLYLH